jgi:hypothetical protein
MAALQAELALAQAIQRVQPTGGGYGQPGGPGQQGFGQQGFGQQGQGYGGPTNQPMMPQTWWNPGPGGAAGYPIGSTFWSGQFAGFTVVDKLQVVVDGQIVQELVLRNLNTGNTLDVGITEGQIP